MTTISYDLPVKDLISGLDATGHVTHTKHRKTMVTLHHNGGVLSHEGVLNVWRDRPASAHFDVDSAGAVAQYVRVDEYAWACGDTLGNQTSISIEMCNQTGPPNWAVGDATWKSAARLAGWLFAHVIGTRPTSSNLVRHKYWSATDCAGPFIDQVYGQILQLSQQTYDNITNGGPGGGGGDEESDVDEQQNAYLVEIWQSTARGQNKPELSQLHRHVNFLGNLIVQKTDALTARIASLDEQIGQPAPVVLTPEDRAAIIREVRSGLAAEVADLLAERLKD